MSVQEQYDERVSEAIERARENRTNDTAGIVFGLIAIAEAIDGIRQAMTRDAITVNAYQLVP